MLATLVLPLQVLTLIYLMQASKALILCQLELYCARVPKTGVRGGAGLLYTPGCP